MVSVTCPCATKVLPAIIVVIEQMRAPTGKSESRAAHTGWVGHILEAAFPVVVRDGRSWLVVFEDSPG